MRRVAVTGRRAVADAAAALVKRLRGMIKGRVGIGVRGEVVAEWAANFCFLVGASPGPVTFGAGAIDVVGNRDALTIPNRR